MLREQKAAIAASFDAALLNFVKRESIEVDAAMLPRASLERPRQAAHGDLACNLALQVARSLSRSPRVVAQALADGVLATRDPELIERLDIAGPGFINITVSDSARRAVVAAVLEAGAQFGCNRDAGGERVIIEFVSANPTGPLHVGHGRQAALGDCLAYLLEANGWSVTREFYYNDAGAQIDNLALSVQARARGVALDDPAFPADGYRGDYIADIARRYRDGERIAATDVPVEAPADASGVPGTGAGAPGVAASGEDIVAERDVDDLDAIRAFAVACLRQEQNADLDAFGVRFDRFFLESSLYTQGKVEQTVAALRESGHVYEKDSALWLRSTDFGDDKDRVMRKSGGGYTYFVPDVAYHLGKWQRGFRKAINVQGSDHHGTVARVRAGLQALDAGIPAGWPDYVLHKMVTVMRGGEIVKLSKRAGSYVTLRDLIVWSAGDGDLVRGRDAVRFFLVSRKADTEFVFDVDLALARTDENPVYYVQYAHARICSVLAQARAQYPPVGPERPVSEQLAPLESEREYSLMAKLSEWPDVVEAAAADLAPHAVSFYLKELAAALHSYYNSERFLVGDAAVRTARLMLLLAVRQVLRNGLSVIGVSAPERM